MNSHTGKKKREYIINALNSALDKYGPIPEKQIELLADCVRISHLRKKDFLVRAGDITGPLAIVVSGIVRNYFLNDNGDEKNIAFYSEGVLTGVYSPEFDENNPVWFNLQALTDCDLLTLSPAAMNEQRHYDRVFWAEIERRFFSQIYLKMEKRVRSFLTQDATERYEAFRKDYPDLINRLPSNQIASYLGITPVSLSRIRNQLIK